MENQAQMGMNRTGAQMSPVQVKDVQSYALERLGPGRQPPTALESGAFAAIHETYTREAEPIGSVPMPGTVKGAVKSAVAAIKGDKPTLLLDKLGERLAFERTGTRLYDALIMKCAALEGDGTPRDIGALPDLEELRQIRADEEAHFLMLTECMQMLGADPTAMTPCADVAGVASSGLLQVVSDPRTTMAQALSAVLMAELTDNASWELLTELVEEAGYDDMAERFADAIRAEEQHLQFIRGCLRESLLREGAVLRS